MWARLPTPLKTVARNANTSPGWRLVFISSCGLIGAIVAAAATHVIGSAVDIAFGRALPHDDSVLWMFAATFLSVGAAGAAMLAQERARK